jgi:putative tricarboxylic transport membrane protein
MTFVERPMAATLLAVALIVLVAAVLPTIRRGREEVFKEEP